MKRVWITKDGQHLRIREMAISHIKNCIAIIKRWQAHAEREAHVFAGTLHGEQAQYAMDDILVSLEENGFGALDGGRSDAFLEAFEAELERRDKMLCGGNLAIE